MEIVKNLQRLQGIDGDYDNDSGSGPDRIARRKTIQNLEKARQPRRQIGTLDVAFKKRFMKLTASAEENNASTPILTRRMTMRRETIRALEVRKNSVMAERRKSQMQTLGANNEYGVTGVTNVRKILINQSPVESKKKFSNWQIFSLTTFVQSKRKTFFIIAFDQVLINIIFHTIYRFPNFFQINNNNNLQPARPVRSASAGINIKEIFNQNGGPNHQIYGTTAAVNQAYEHVEEEDGNSIRLTPRNQVSWGNNNQTNQNQL